MDEIEGPALDARHQKLLEMKLGKLLRWEQPKIVDTVGPFDPSVFEEFEAGRREAIVQCRAWLDAHSEDQIAVLLAGERSRPDAVHAAWRSFLNDRISLLSGGVPPWYAGGFGHPDHVADFDYWAKMPRFTVDEATCLSVGVEPADFPVAKLQDLGREDSPKKLWPALQFLIRQRELLKRQFDSASHGWKVQPSEYLVWAEKVAFAAHPEFLRLLRLYHGKVEKPVETTGDLPRTHNREIDKIAQLFTAMAIDYLGYNPRQKRSPIPKEIAEIAASMGLSISTDTILKYLRTGAEFVPEDWEPPRR